MAERAERKVSRHQARKRAVDLLFEAEARGLSAAEVAESRAARSMQDEATAATILREALGLWHGRALADLAYEPFAQAAGRVSNDQ